MLLPYLALLQVGFAMPSLLPGPRCALTAPFHPYRPPVAFTVGSLGGLLSVALSVGSRPPGVTWHLIRRSPDFPPSPSPSCDSSENSDCPADSRLHYLIHWLRSLVAISAEWGPTFFWRPAKSVVFAGWASERDCTRTESRGKPAYFFSNS